MNRRGFLRGLVAVPMAGAAAVAVAGAGGSSGRTITIVNRPKIQLEVVKGRARFDGGEYVRQVILRDARENGRLERALRGK